MVESKKTQLEVGGKIVEVETGKYANSATSSVTVRCGDTMLFVHCCVSKEPRVGIDFFPLLLSYALIPMHSYELYIDESKLSAQTKEHLAKDDCHCD